MSQGSKLLGVNLDSETGRLSGHTSMGGSADSFYEYLVKGWIQGRKSEPELLDAFFAAIIAARKSLVHTATGPKKLTYVRLALATTC